MSTKPTSDGNVGRSSVLVSAFTMLSRVAGLARDVVIAMVFGASPAADAFFIAFKIPNFFRRLSAEGAFSAGFIPVLARWRQERPEELRSFVDYVSGALGSVLLLITVLGIAAAPFLTVLFAPGYAGDPQQLALTSDLLRWTFPYLLLISLTALSAGVLNTFGKFSVPAFTPVLMNLVLIAFAWWLSPFFATPIIAVGVGVLIAGVVQFTFQLPSLAALNMLPRPRVRFSHPAVRQVWTLMLPAVFGASVAQISLVLDTWFVSFLDKSAVSWLYYADRIVELPVGVFAIGLATVLLPRLSALHAAGDNSRLGASLDWGLRLGVLVSLPGTAAIMVLATPIMASLFGYGAFDAIDVERSAAALVAYAVGLSGFVLVKLLVPGYFARHDTRTPLRIAIVSVSTNIVLNAINMQFLGHVGLALSTSLASLVNMALLWRGLRREKVLHGGAPWWPFLLRVMLATALMAAFLAATAWQFEWLAMPALYRALHLAWICAVGASCYGVALLLLGLRPRQFVSPA